MCIYLASVYTLALFAILNICLIIGIIISGGKKIHASSSSSETTHIGVSNGHSDNIKLELLN